MRILVSSFDQLLLDFLQPERANQLLLVLGNVDVGHAPRVLNSWLACHQKMGPITVAALAVGTGWHAAWCSELGLLTLYPVERLPDRRQA